MGLTVCLRRTAGCAVGSLFRVSGHPSAVDRDLSAVLAVVAANRSVVVDRLLGRRFQKACSAPRQKEEESCPAEC